MQGIKHSKNISINPPGKYSASGFSKFAADSGSGPLIKNINFWIWLLITFGAVIRLVQYFHNRSLWTDEAMLAPNIVNRSFSQFLEPLDNKQGAPVGFMLISKLSAILFGANEYALRLFPLITGLAAIILFYYLSRYYLKPAAVFIAVALFSFSEPLFYYASEFKPYSSDVFFSILLLILFTKIKFRELNTLRILTLSCSGAIIIWFSFPSVFMLSGIGIYILINLLLKADLKSFYKFGIICVIWIISFAAFYFLTLRSLSHNTYMEKFWNDSFMPIPSLSLGFFHWFIDAFFTTFGFNLTVELSGLAGLLFVLGIIDFHKNNRTAFLIFILPVLVTLLVSMVHKYPFQGRLLLFLIPILFIGTAAGTDRLKTATMNYKSIYIILIAFLLYPVFYNSIWSIHKPIEKEEIKRTLSYLKENIQPNDYIYLYYGSIPAFKFYSNKYINTNNPVVNGIQSRDNWQKYINDLNQLRGKSRVWILFSHIYKRTNEGTFFLTYLKSIGKLNNSYKTTGAELYLFNFQ